MSDVVCDERRLRADVNRTRAGGWVFMSSDECEVREMVSRKVQSAVRLQMPAVGI